MKVTCRYSGVEFKVQGFGRFSATSHHPIFDLPLTKLLTDIYPQYVKGNLSRPEIHLLYLAFLKHTDLIDFKHPAVPSLKTIHSTMSILIQTLNWSTYKNVNFSLPRYAVNRENFQIKNIAQWINAWYTARDNWLERQNSSAERTSFLIRQEALEKLIRAPYKKVEDYAAKLGRWALEASSLPLEHENFTPWIAVFKLREPELFKEEYKQPIQDLLLHLEANLNAVDNPIAQKALAFIRRIAYKNNAGILYGLDEFEEEEQTLYLSRDQKVPFVILTPHERMLRNSMQDAPEIEPLPEAYPSRVAYLVAKAKWGVAQSLKEKLASTKSAIEIAASPHSLEAIRQEEKTLIDPSFDDTPDILDGDNRSYEEYAEDVVLEALARMEATAQQEKKTDLSEEI